MGTSSNPFKPYYYLHLSQTPLRSTQSDSRPFVLVLFNRPSSTMPRGVGFIDKRVGVRLPVVGTVGVGVGAVFSQKEMKKAAKAVAGGAKKGVDEAKKGAKSIKDNVSGSRRPENEFAVAKPVAAR